MKRRANRGPGAGVDSVADSRDRLTLAEHQHEADDEDDQAGTHEDVADEVEVDCSPKIDVDREGEDRADDEQYDSSSNTHDPDATHMSP